MLAEKKAVPLAMLSEFELVGLDERSGVRRQLEAALRAACQKLPTFGRRRARLAGSSERYAVLVSVWALPWYLCPF